MVVPWASAAGSGGHVPPWIFIHGTDIVDIGLNSAIFRYFFAILWYFSPLPPLEEAL